MFELSSLLVNSISSVFSSTFSTFSSVFSLTVSSEEISLVSSFWSPLVSLISLSFTTFICSFLIFSLLKLLDSVALELFLPIWFIEMADITTVNKIAQIIRY